MRRSVAEFLEARLCREAIMMSLTPVVAEALPLLRANLVWSLTYDQGRLLGEVGVSDLLAYGQLETVRAFVAAGGMVTTQLRRVLEGERVEDQELAELQLSDRIELLLAQHAAGERRSPAARAAVIEELGALARDDYERRLLARLAAHLAGTGQMSRGPLTEEAVAPLTEEKLDEKPDLYTFISSGDLPGCLQQLARAIARAEEAERKRVESGEDPPRFGEWPRLAAVYRALTGDDAAAMALLERAPFCDVREDWVEIFGAAGRARVQREKDEVLAVIDAAFDGVPFPGPKHRSLYQAEAADNYAGCDQSRDHKGRWQELPREQILDCQWAIPHLGEHSIPYYLPAIMSLAVREHDQRLEDHKSRWIFESLEYHLLFALNPGDENRRLYHEERHRQLTRAQLGAIARFADYYRCTYEDRRHWHALAAGAPWPAIRAEPKTSG